MGWRPGVRSVLILVVLLSTLSTGLLAGSRLSSGWAFRQQAEVVARDAAQLKPVASPRALISALSLPIGAVSYAADLGLSTTALDAVLKPAVPYAEQLEHATAAIAEFPDFSSPTLRDDLANMKLDIDALWYRTYDQLQADISAWRSPRSFGVHASTLIQTSQAFLSGDHLLERAGSVLQGVADDETRRELIEADGVYRVARGRDSRPAHRAAQPGRGDRLSHDRCRPPPAGW